MITEHPGKIKKSRWVGPKAPGWVPLSQISVAAMGAVIASEDTSFFSHQGVDFYELREAIKKDLEERKFVRGASTLTQQVIKNVYLGHEKTLWRKFKEFFWAQEMSKVLTKSEILAFYLNMAEWGPGIYGIGEASRYYFGKASATLSAKQGAFLAVLLPSPKKYHSYFKNKELTPWAQKRINKILKVMLSMKFISEDEYDDAQEEKLWEIEQDEDMEEVQDEIEEVNDEQEKSEDEQSED
jgi:monofunctional biosynthetic peptidoglycan transglycosylase